MRRKLPHCLGVFLLLLREGESTNREGETLCYEQRVVVSEVQTSHLVPVTTTAWEFCWSGILNGFQCPRDETHWEKQDKGENITRVIHVPSCCPGYEETEEEIQKEIPETKKEVPETNKKTPPSLKCTPTCSPPCSEHGSCSAPFTCSCDRGYSGARCDERGCPGGNWGPNCMYKCFCANGGQCDAVTGNCSCPAGYNGPLCQEECGGQTWGADCKQQCQGCETGHRCHHLTGQCVQCASDTFGPLCENQCNCSSPGTALCHNIDGRCFCEANWFGAQCQHFCPFGFLAGECLPTPGSSCSCPSDLFTCDPELGCVCPDGQECGIEGAGMPVQVGFLQKEGGSEPKTGLIVGVVFILVVGGLVVSAILIYYKRRLSRLKKDLANRTGNDNPGSMIDDPIRPEPLPAMAELQVVENNRIAFTRPPTTHLTVSQSACDNPLYIVNYSRPEKNINQSRDTLSGVERSPSNLDKEAKYRKDSGLEDDLYQEPKEVRNDLREMLEKEDLSDYETYDHLDHKRTINELSPNYFKFKENV